MPRRCCRSATACPSSRIFPPSSAAPARCWPSRSPKAPALLFLAVAPGARGGFEARAKHLVEMREVVEAPAVGDLGDVGVALALVAQRGAAGVEPVLEQPAAERLADALEAQMHGPHRDAEVGGDALRVEIAVVQVLPAEGEQRLELQVRMQLDRRQIDGAGEPEQI